MVDAFTGHSSGSHGRSEVRRLEVRTRRDLSHFGAQGVEHQVARRSENTTNVSNLKTLALHLQVSNDGDRRTSELISSISNNLERDGIAGLGCVDNISAETC
jgi:hypothetical protein